MKPLFFLVPFFSTAYQIFIKLATNEPMPWLLFAVVSEFLAFLLWMKVLAAHDLSKAFPLSAASYILVLSSAWLIFKEEIMTMQIIGSIFIMSGVWLIGTTLQGSKK